MEIAMKMADDLLRDFLGTPDRQPVHESQRSQDGADIASRDPGRPPSGRMC